MNEQIRALEDQRPKPLPMAAIVTDGDYRFTPDGAGDEPAPGKGVKQEVGSGSFLFEGPGRYQAPPSYFLIRGDIESRGSLMKPGFIDVITFGNPPTEIPPPDGRTSGRRRALAEWLGSPENPLTARVIVNRIWSHHFGQGIVSTLDNFGKMGAQPTHPALLDWLAVEFMSHGWSVKQMHRLMMTSEAYQMASQFDSPADAAKSIRGRNAYLVALPHAAPRCGERARRHYGRRRRARPDDVRAPGVSASSERSGRFHHRRSLAEGRGRTGRVAAQHLCLPKARAWFSRCSRPSTFLIRTRPAAAATFRPFLPKL